MLLLTKHQVENAMLNLFVMFVTVACVFSLSPYFEICFDVNLLNYLRAVAVE